MNRSLLWICLFIFLCITIQPVLAASEKQNFSLNPVLNHGKKWRIAYYEGGPYQNYPNSLKALALALSKLGWMKKFSMPVFSDKTDSAKIWQWLCKNAKSDYIQFVADAYWSGNWNDALRKKNRDAALNRMRKTKDIDLMLAMGTWAGQDFANNEHSVPTVVISVSNPVSSNISKSIEDSGFDHLIARVDPDRYMRQLTLFYDAFHFKKLGIVYDRETQSGRSYAAIDDVEKSAIQNGFEVVACHVPSSNSSMSVTKADIVRCYTEIANNVDAVYITVHRGVTPDILPDILAPLYAKRIPTFSQQNSEAVRYGVLMSSAQTDFKFFARFYAETIAKIFNGAKPRDLPQLFEEPSRIAINLKTAAIIGYDPPIDILGVADEILKEIQDAPASTE
ncbi:MAG: ABC transporter substrate-binding protein [Desulfatirhabdiaceae bacterium]